MGASTASQNLPWAGGKQGLNIHPQPHLHCPTDQRLQRTKQGEKPSAGKASLVLGPNRRTGRVRVGAGGGLWRVPWIPGRAREAHAEGRGGACARRGRVPRAAPLGAHVPGCNRAPDPPPPPPPATAAAEGRAGPGKRRRPRRRRRRPLGEAPPASRPAQAQSGGPACERRRPRRPQAAAAGGDGPRLPRGMSRRPSRRAGRRRRCAGSCCSCSRSPGAAPRAPSASRPWTPEAARGLKAAAAAA